MLNILLIAIIAVFIVDLSGVVDYAKRALWKRLYKGLPYKEDWTIKPFNCSLCITWWMGLLYILFTGMFTWKYIAFVALISFLTPVIKDIMILIQDLFNKLIDLIYKVIN